MAVRDYVKKYRSIETTIPALQVEYTDYVPAGVHAHRWVVCNDSTHVTLLVKVNSLDNEVISIKAGEFFGDDISVDHLYIMNEFAETCLVRIRFGGVDNH